MGRKVGFSAVFKDVTKRGVLSEETLIHTAKMSAIKVTSKEICKKLVICTLSQSSMQSIDCNKENYPILNQIYDILAELQAQDKMITLCKVPAHMGNKRN